MAGIGTQIFISHDRSALDAPLAALPGARPHSFFLPAFDTHWIDGRQQRARGGVIPSPLPGFDYFKAVACLELGHASPRHLHPHTNPVGPPPHTPSIAQGAARVLRECHRVDGAVVDPGQAREQVRQLYRCRRSSSAREERCRRWPDGPLRQAVYAGERRGGADDGAVGVLLRRRRAPGRRRLQLPGRAVEWIIFALPGAAVALQDSALQTAAAVEVSGEITLEPTDRAGGIGVLGLGDGELILAGGLRGAAVESLIASRVRRSLRRALLYGGGRGRGRRRRGRRASSGRSTGHLLAPPLLEAVGQHLRRRRPALRGG